MAASKLVRRAVILSAAVAATLGSPPCIHANSELDVSNGATDLTSASSYSQLAAPTTTSDVTFDSGVTYSPAAFTVNSNLSIGTLNDLDGTQTLSISNTGSAATTLTLNGGGDSVSGSASGDLLYVATGATLNIANGTNALGLSLGPVGNLDVAGTSTISSIVSGTNGLTKTGVGTLTLSGANTFTSSVTVSAGTLKLGSTTALGALANTTTVASGATLDLNGSDIHTYTGAITINGAGVGGVGALINSGGGLTVPGGLAAVTLGSAATFSSGSARLDINGTLNAAGFAFTKIGAGYTAMKGATSNLTVLNINAGSWEVSNATGLGVNAASTVDTVAPGAILTFYNANQSYANTIDLGGTISTGSGSASLTGPIVETGASTIGGSLTFTSAASVTGTGNLAVNGTDTFAAPLSFTGNLALSGSSTFSGSVNNVGTITNSAGTNTISGNIGSSVTTLTNSGGTLNLSGTNAYSATVSVTAGTLEFANTAAMNGYPAPGPSHAVTVSSGATLGLGVGGAGYFSNADIAGFVAGTNNVTFASGSSVGLDTTNAGGSFTLSDTLTGGIGLTKLGSGVLVPTANNAYTGATLVSGGVLRATDGSTLPSGSLLNLNGGVLETAVNFARTGGTAAGNVEITGGTSGFSANGGNISVAFGSTASPTALTWGTAPFNPGTLDLNETTATGTLNFLNAINLNGAVRTVQVNATASGTAATLSGLLTGTSGGINKTGAGNLIISNTSNAYTGASTASGGTLTFAGASTLPASSGLSLAGGTISVLNNGAGSNSTITLGNAVTPANNTTSTLNVGNNGSNTANTVVFGALSNSGSGATINFTGANGYLISFPSLTLPNGTGNNTYLNPTSTSVAITGAVTNPETGFATGNYDTLYLYGATTGNSIGGAISDSATGSSTLGGYSRVVVGNATNAVTWTLAGASTYTGFTNVNANGTLILTGSLGNTPITVANGGVFAPHPGAGSNFAGTNAANALGATLTLSAGSTFSMVDGGIGTFNLQQGTSYSPATAALTIQGATLNFEVNSATADKLAVGVGAAAVSGANTINVTPIGGSLTLGASYPLISANAGVTGIFTFPDGVTSEAVNVGGTTYTLSLSNSATAETLNVGSTPGLTWTGQNGGSGAANSSWDTTTASTNWSSGTTATSYTDGSTVLFQDVNPVTGTNVSNSTVTIQAAGVMPASVTFSNSAVNYTVNNASGSVGIGGATSLTKSGTGTVTLAGANTYTGGTFLNGGVVNVAAAETAGTSGPLGASGAITFGGGTLQYSATNTFDYSSRFSTAANQAISIDTNGQSVSFATALTSSGGTLTKQGAGTLTLTTSNNANTYTGATVINGGILALTGGGGQQGVLAGTPTITVNSGGQLLINASSNDTLGYTGGKEALIINDGSVLNNGSSKRVTLQNNVTMTGGTLGGSSAGDSANNGAYSFNGAGVVATSDAAGSPATISANIGTQQPITFNVTRGTSSSLTAASPDLLISSNIVPFTANDGITKSGTGTMVLTGTGNNYSGATAVSGGTLRVNGALTGTGTSALITVASGAIFGGSGSIAEPATINGTITAGPDALTAGTFTTAAQTWNSGGNDLFKLTSNPSGSSAGNPSAGGTSATWDEIKFTTLTVASTAALPFTITVDYTGSGFNPSSSFVIPIAYSASASAIDGGTAYTPADITISPTGDTLPAGTTLANFSVVENANGSEIDLAYSATPEPASIGLLGLASLGLLKRRRRAAR